MVFLGGMLSETVFLGILFGIFECCFGYIFLHFKYFKGMYVYSFGIFWYLFRILEAHPRHNYLTPGLEGLGE